MIGRGAEKKAGRESSKSSLTSAQASPWGLLVVLMPLGGVTGVLPFFFGGGAAHLGKARGGRAPRALVGVGGRCPGVSRASGAFFWWRSPSRATEGVGFCVGRDWALGPRFLVSRCVERGPREEQEMHRWERHGRADRVFNANDSR